MKYCFFTLAARNYLSYAATLMQSLRDAHPDSERVIGLVDAPGGDDAAPTDLDLAARVAPVWRIGIAPLANMSFRYSVMELATAVKPFYFTHLLDTVDADAFVYLDPDILVLRPLDEVGALIAGGAGVVVVPHITAGIDDDGKLPDEIAILQSGVYNLGFLALADRPATRRLLDWWRARLAERCLVDPPNGLFVDQRWMDFAPAFVAETRVLHHPGYDVAYWNVMQRPIDRPGEDSGEARWTAGGAPLVFFHFSGVIPDDPTVLSKHQTRLTVADLGQGRILFRHYLDRLHRNRWAETSRIAYGFERFKNGRRVHPLMRRLYGEDTASAAGDPFAELADFCDAFDPAFGPPAPITRLMAAVWRARPDLQRRFDLAEIRGRLGLARWFAERGGPDIGVDAESLARAAALTPPPSGTDVVVTLCWSGGSTAAGLSLYQPGVQSAVLPIPPLAEVSGALVLRPADRAGAVRLHGMAVLGADDSELWLWQADEGLDGFAHDDALAVVGRLPTGIEGAIVLIQNPAAGLTLPLAPSQRAGLRRGGRLVCRMEPISEYRLGAVSAAFAVEAASQASRVAALGAEIAALGAERDRVLGSLSWRVTRPLRGARRLLGALTRGRLAP